MYCEAGGTSQRGRCVCSVACVTQSKCFQDCAGSPGPAQSWLLLAEFRAERPAESRLRQSAPREARLFFFVTRHDQLWAGRAEPSRAARGENSSAFRPNHSIVSDRPARRGARVRARAASTKSRLGRKRASPRRRPKIAGLIWPGPAAYVSPARGFVSRTGRLLPLSRRPSLLAFLESGRVWPTAASPGLAPVDCRHEPGLRGEPS